MAYVVPEEGLTLGEIVEGFIKKDDRSAIPWIVRLLENPESPIALPGKITLERHDCIHAILKCGLTNIEEALVIGFTMGSDVLTQPYHMAVFKFIARLFYPENYRFQEVHLKVLDLGFQYGRKPYTINNVNRINFEEHKNTQIHELRQRFGIYIDELKFLRNQVNTLQTSSLRLKTSLISPKGLGRRNDPSEVLVDSNLIIKPKALFDFGKLS